MGRIKTQIVKRYAKLLLEKFPDKFTDDFESNKRVLMETIFLRTLSGKWSKTRRRFTKSLE